MKINWGTGIVVALVLFVTLMGSMTYMAMQQRFDLVSENYYEEELQFQDIIDQRKNSLKLESLAEIKVEEGRVFLIIPEELNGYSNTSIHMYFEKDAREDFNFDLNRGETKVEIPFKQMNEGKWIAKFSLEKEGKSYRFDPEIVF